MIDRLLKYFMKFGSLSPSEIDAITESSIIKEYQKRDYLLKEGQRTIESFFVLQGCIRQFNLLDGEEKTTRFFFEEEWLISLEDISEGAVSIHNWICMEDCVLVSGNEKNARELFKKYPHLETISRKIVESAYSEMQKSLSFYHSDTPEERYLRLLNKQPNILQRIPQYHIASYIGVKPESLSRIRKRIAEK